MATLGLKPSHKQEEVDFILETIDKNDIQAFVEVGVHIGGLASILVDYVVHYLGIEINGQLINGQLKDIVQRRHHAEFWIMDAWQPFTILKCRQWLEGKSPAFIYCDGGDKPKELEIYVPLTRPGDIIAVHDYGDYKRAEITPNQAARIMANQGLLEYVPAWMKGGLRIAAWSKE